MYYISLSCLFKMVHFIEFYLSNNLKKQCFFEVHWRASSVIRAVESRSQRSELDYWHHVSLWGIFLLNSIKLLEDSWVAGHKKTIQSPPKMRGSDKYMHLYGGPKRL